jgi:hypothetical protein
MSDALALFLLLLPPGSPVPPWSWVVRGEMQQLAIGLEILDAREAHYVLTRPPDFASDLNLLRQRQRDLDNSPLMHDVYRFPRREQVNELLNFNRDYRNHLAVRQALYPRRWWEFQAAIQETDDLYKAWDSLRDGGGEFYYVYVRRYGLKRLRALIGDDAYYSGHMPPHVPLWRFEQID